MNTPSTVTALRNPTSSEIPLLLTELDASGLGVAAFARSLNLKPNNLYVATRKRKARIDPAPAFDPVRIVGPGCSQPGFELHLRNGHQLTVPVDFDGANLRRLLEVLGGC